MRAGNNIRLRADGRYEARYQKGRDENGRIVYGCCYGKTQQEAESKRHNLLQEASPVPAVKQMKLLILGAGGQGQVIKEIAENLNIFADIAFLDDDPQNSLAIGRCTDCHLFVKEYPIAIPSVGNNELRHRWIDMLVASGFVLPTLVHRTAVVSPSAQVGYGTVVEARCTIGANAKVGCGCIVSSGATIDRAVEVADWTHVGCGQVVVRNV